MTAYHVVDGASSIKVTFADGTDTSAEIVDSTPENDIAVLQPTSPPGLIVPAVLGGGVQIGDDTYAVGNPLGLGGSLSAGVISGLDRTVTRENGDGDLKGLIQFDAAVNPGSSGGPLPTGPGRSSGSSPRWRTRPGSGSSPASASRSRSERGRCGARPRPVVRPTSPDKGTANRRWKLTPTATSRWSRCSTRSRRSSSAQDILLERLIVALLARGHILVEGVPGLAKTMAIKTLAEAIGGMFQRIQFTPDLVPADLIGTRIYNQKSGEFNTSLGPVFTNLLLADEINRAPAKVQSALLEVMQERQVTIGRETHPVPNPFLVMATQNPIESEGTYPLPEAQVDRFMLKVLVSYPTATEEFVIVERMTGRLEAVRKVLETDQLVQLQQAADAVYVDPALIEYAVRLVTATREPKSIGLGDLEPYVLYGASPRAAINLILAARALAFVRGRTYALPQDVADLALDVMRHRLVLSYEALADGVSADDLLRQILITVPRPEVPLDDRSGFDGRPPSRPIYS